MKTKKQLEMAGKIYHHGVELKYHFGLNIGAVELSKKLFRLENRMHRAAEQYCNGEITEEQLDKIEASVLKSLKNILGSTEQVYINLDPRGYSLKLKEGIDFYYRDWGGYGILAPDFRE